MSLQPAQFGANPFLAAGGALAASGASGWFERRTALRHQYNQNVIAAHLKDKSVKNKATKIGDIDGLVTSAGSRGWLSRRAGLQNSLDTYHVDAMFKKPKKPKGGTAPTPPPQGQPEAPKPSIYVPDFPIRNPRRP